MTRLAPLLAKYGEYHRDRRNVLTHMLGIPMIVLAVEILLSRPVWESPFFTVTPALIATLAAGAYYLKLDRRLGGLMTLILITFAWLGMELARGDFAIWLWSGIGLFVAGWVLQLVGHVFEGKKPAFVDDLKSLLIGPLFVLAEGGFALGMLDELKREMEQLQLR